MTPEQLIYELQREIQRLTEELSTSIKDRDDFETLAKEWKKGYDSNIYKLKIEIEHLKQENEDLRDSLEELKYRD